MLSRGDVSFRIVRQFRWRRMTDFERPVGMRFLTVFSCWSKGSAGAGVCCVGRCDFLVGRYLMRHYCSVVWGMQQRGIAETLLLWVLSIMQLRYLVWLLVPLAHFVCRPLICFLIYLVQFCAACWKEKVYAVRRFWEASDRPWRPFLLPNMGLAAYA